MATVAGARHLDEPVHALADVRSLVRGLDSVDPRRSVADTLTARFTEGRRSRHGFASSRHGVVAGAGISRHLLRARGSFVFLTCENPPCPALVRKPSRSSPNSSRPEGRPLGALIEGVTQRYEPTALRSSSSCMRSTMLPNSSRRQPHRAFGHVAAANVDARGGHQNWASHCKSAHRRVFVVEDGRFLWFDHDGTLLVRLTRPRGASCMLPSQRHDRSRRPGNSNGVLWHRSHGATSMISSAACLRPGGCRRHRARAKDSPRPTRRPMQPRDVSSCRRQ